MSPSCFVCSLKPYSPVGLCCITLFFFFTDFWLSSEERGMCRKGRHRAYFSISGTSVGKN